MESWEEWQKAYRSGMLVIWPPDEVRTIVNQLRQRYDPASQAICEAHITVTQPFLREPNRHEWSRINGVLQRFSPFEISYGPLNSFLPYPCIWYEIHPAEKVLELRDSLHQAALFNLEREFTTGFIPHMTITEGLSGPEVDEALLQHLQGLVESGSFPCEDLAYIVPNERFEFKVANSLPLGREGT